ncbi:MAG: GreA/GreB family elongation factor [Rhizobiales bacterium]|nr:GreA/GreB family elongation factor [Hyphomicrobiales bacterium]
MFVMLYPTQELEPPTIPGRFTATIVSSQSDVDTGHVNQHSAIARALVGGEVGEESEVDLPQGSESIQITKIRKHSAV